MADYTFFAMLFYIVSSLAPNASGELRLQNGRHPDQSLVWTQVEDGRWAMTINGREMGHFERRDGAVLHHTGIRDTDRYAFGDLAAPVTAESQRIELHGQYGPTVLQVVRSAQSPPRLVDPSRAVLTVPLVVHAR